MKEKTCTLLFLKKGESILLAMKKRGFGAGRYNGVGGKVEPNETIEQALVRECQEEIGVTPLNYYKVGENDFIYEQGRDEPKRMYTHIYFCDQWEGEPAESEEMTPQWFTFDTIPYDHMWEDDKHWLPVVLQKNSIAGIFNFDENDAILSHTINIVEARPDGLTD